MKVNYSFFYTFFIILLYVHLSRAQEIPQENIVVKIKESASNNKRLLSSNNEFYKNKFASLGITDVRKIGKPQNTNSQNKRLKSNTHAYKPLGSYFKLAVPENKKAAMIERLGQEPWVAYVEPLHNYELLYIPNDTHQAAHWGHVNTQTYEAWDISQGDTSVVIGIVDSGVRTDHPSLAPQFQYNNLERYGLPGVDDDNNGYVDDSLGYNFAGMNTNVNDLFGHGTEVSGVAAAKVNDAFGTFGTGHNTRFMPINIVLPPGYLVNVFEAMLYAAENGCKIINVSLGRPGGGVSQYEQDIINYITNELDVLIVAAAGNTSGLIDFYPASYENVLSIAHSMQNDERFWGGSYSYFVDLLAPGHQIPTTTHNGDVAGYKSVIGSSYSAPFVAGVAGLLRAAYPNYKASQIAEILRMSADEEVYELAGNQNFREKIGKGRLNALSALQQANSLTSIRASNINFTGSDELLIIRGDTMTITATFTNILNAIGSDTKVTLSSTSPYISVIDSVFNIGALGELDSIQNTENPFKIKLSKAIPENTQVYFKLTFEDENYTDYQYFALQTDILFDITKDDWKLSLQGNGRLGYVRLGTSNFGLGLQWKNKQILADAGLIFGSDSLSISDAINIQNTEIIADFNSTSPITIDESDSVFQVSENFKDGIKYPQIDFQQQLKFIKDRDHLELNYQLTNASEDTIYNTSIGFYTNFFLNENNMNAAGWDSLYNFGYANHDGLYFGIKQFDKTAVAYNLDLLDTTTINLSDNISDVEKYQLMSEGFSQSFTATSNFAQINRRQLPQILPNDTVNIPLTLVAGNSLNDIQEQLAQVALDKNYEPFFSAIPNVNDTIICFSDTINISWENGQTYNYYLSENDETPFANGNVLQVFPSGDSLNLWVSNHDKVFESTRIGITLYFSDAHLNLDWELPESAISGDTISLSVSNTDNLTWSLNLGDGTQFFNENNIVHVYDEKGVYSINLFAESEVPCFTTLTQEIIVLKKSAIPVIQDTIRTCIGDNVVISPENGNNFRFYINDIVVAEQLRYVIENVTESMSIKVSNTSDDLESEEKTVYIELHPVPDLTTFATIPDSLNIENNPLKMNATFGTGWQWQASNGESSKEQTFEATFDSVGIETITLTVTDEFGCNYTETSKLTIWQSTITSLNHDFNKTEIQIFPLPVSDVFYVQLPQIKDRFDVTIKTLKGEIIPVQVNKLNNQLSIDVSKLPSGMYIIQFSTSNQLYSRKFIKQ